MDKTIAIASSIAMTAICWGVYGPILHIGQGKLGASPAEPGRLRAFICVGLAYFVIAVMVPVILLTLGWQEKGQWTVGGFGFSFLGGTVGALGALGIVLALANGGTPTYVMPIVFGCAPICNTLWQAYWANAFKDAKPMQMSLFMAGIILSVVGAIIIFTFAPKSKPHTSSEKHVKAAVPTEPAPQPEKPVKDNTVWRHPS
jgi:hypothetical protein